MKNDLYLIQTDKICGISDYFKYGHIWFRLIFKQKTDRGRGNPRSVCELEPSYMDSISRFTFMIMN